MRELLARLRVLAGGAIVFVVREVLPVLFVMWLAGWTATHMFLRSAVKSWEGAFVPLTLAWCIALALCFQAWINRRSRADTEQLSWVLFLVGALENLFWIGHGLLIDNPIFIYGRVPCLILDQVLLAQKIFVLAKDRGRSKLRTWMKYGFPLALASLVLIGLCWSGLISRGSTWANGIASAAFSSIFLSAAGWVHQTWTQFQDGTLREKTFSFRISGWVLAGCLGWIYSEFLEWTSGFWVVIAMSVVFLTNLILLFLNWRARQRKPVHLPAWLRRLTRWPLHLVFSID